jgi:hypothetical protein
MHGGGYVVRDVPGEPGLQVALAEDRALNALAPAAAFFAHKQRSVVQVEDAKRGHRKGIKDAEGLQDDDDDHDGAGERSSAGDADAARLSRTEHAT